MAVQRPLRYSVSMAREALRLPERVNCVMCIEDLVDLFYMSKSAPPVVMGRACKLSPIKTGPDLYMHFHWLSLSLLYSYCAGILPVKFSGREGPQPGEF